MPLEALRNDTTPPGLHYLLNHFDIPFIDAEQLASADRRRRAAVAGAEPQGAAPGADASASR